MASLSRVVATALLLAVFGLNAVPAQAQARHCTLHQRAVLVRQ